MKIKNTHPQAIQHVDEFGSSSDLEKCSITSIAHQWILWSEWVPSESKQLITIIHRQSLPLQSINQHLVKWKAANFLVKSNISQCGHLFEYDSTSFSHLQNDKSQIKVIIVIMTGSNVTLMKLMFQRTSQEDLVSAAERTQTSVQMFLMFFTWSWEVTYIQQIRRSCNLLTDPLNNPLM